MNIFKRFLGAVFERYCRRWLEAKIERVLLENHLQFGPPGRLRIAPTAAVQNTFFNTSSGTIVVEDHALFGYGVQLVTGTHNYRLSGEARKLDWPDAGRDITVRRGAWICAGAVVLGPCEIGEDAVVAAGAVVTESVAPRTVVGGVPARLIKHIDALTPVSI